MALFFYAGDLSGKVADSIILNADDSELIPFCR